MKKLLDSKFLFILALSMVVLIILGVGAFYLFDDSDATFVKDGYVLNPLSAKNEKYLFDKDTPYKLNLSGVVVFEDTDDNEVSVFKDSFLHYMDGSLSFLSNGAILDLNSISGTNAVKFYNITNKSIINKTNNGYIIETNGEDIGLKNFMGRISDKKYIVAGDLEAKIPGNEKDIAGKYFEIVYNDEGVITIENNEVKYQVAAEGTYIYAGDIVIDLGNKKIMQAGEDIMSITAITINGNENIEIVPKTPSEEDEGNGQGQGGAGGDGTGTGDDGQGGATGDADQREDIVIEGLTVSLKDYARYSTKLVVVFDVINKREDDSLILKVTDLNTGKTIDKVYDVLANQEIRISKLSADTKYLLTVINERDGNKYFQKILKTREFGITLEKTYVTAHEIGYKVTVDDDSEIGDIDITLMKYNETDKEYNENDMITYQLSDYTDTIKGVHDGIVFQGLESDTIYTVSLHGFAINSTKTDSLYSINMTVLTLKETPIIGAIDKEILDDGFKLFIEDVYDKDSAIEGYTYYLFDNNDLSDVTFDPEKAIATYARTTAEPLELKIGRDEIESNHNYIYMVSIEYYDNEKYIEEIKEGRVDLFIGNDPYITIQRIDDEITHDTISAMITINDNSCLIAMKDRACNNDYEENPILIDIKEKSGTGKLVTIEGMTMPLEVNDFDINGSTLSKHLTLSSLKEGTTYVITVMAKRSDRPDEGYKELKTGQVYQNEITTKYLASFKGVWTNKNSDTDYAIQGDFKLEENANTYAIAGDMAAGLIEKVIFRLYDGPYSGNLARQTLLASSAEYTEDIKENFYDNEFHITERLFGIDSILALRELTQEKTGKEDDKLSPYYTIAVEVYYADNVRATVDPYGQDEFPIAAYLSSDVEPPTLRVEDIKKSRNDNFNSLLTSGEGGTTVGYRLYIHYDKDGYEDSHIDVQTINIYVYDENNQRVAFYINDRGDKRSYISVNPDNIEGSDFEEVLYMGDGLPNGESSTENPKLMTRGKQYHIKLEIKSVKEGEPDAPVDTQVSESVEVLARKESPKITVMYLNETTKTGEATYKYKIVDVDNAWHNEDGTFNVYYTINGQSAQAIPIVRNLDELNTFTISGLSNGASYSLTYKRDNYDTGDYDTDVSYAVIGEADRLFDGYYNANDTAYNFKYRVINDPLHDNKVTVEILASDDMIDRILIYKVTFTDTKGHSYTVPNDIWNLSKCPNASAEDKNRCFEVEYTALKDMKSEGNEINNITTTIEAIYDNGLTGFEYIDKVGENKEYPYMIMQLDSTASKPGNYLIVNNRTLYDIPASGNRAYPLGYYNFEFRNDLIRYSSKYNIYDVFSINATLNGQGYYVSGRGGINPKMVSVKEMEGIDSTFYFSSITPMIRLDKTISVINGAKVLMTLSGANIDDFCADNTGNTCQRTGDKKLYVQVLDENTLDTVNGNTLAEPLLPTITVPLNNTNETVNAQYTIDIINLLHNSHYYYKVFAYLNDGGTKKLTQIFDAYEKNVPITYEFDSKKLSGEGGILANVSIIPRSVAEGEYNDKELVTTINVNPYDTELNIGFDYDVSYDFCSDIDCNNVIFDKNIPTTAQTMTSVQDITAYDLLYHENYYLPIYFTYSYYDKNSGAVNKIVARTEMVYEAHEDAMVELPELDPVTFVVYRQANYLPDAGGYVVDITVNITDNSRVLENGNFYVKMLDGNDVVGKLMLQGNDGIFRQVGETGAYDTYAFSADRRSEGNMLNKTIRIGGLTENTIYKIVVFGDVHMKNKGYAEYDFEVRSGKEQDGDAVFTTNSYGVAFGAVTYTAEPTGFIVRYGAGSNVDEFHIKTVIVDVKENNRPFYYKEITIGEDNRYLVADEETGSYKFVIEYDEEGKVNLPPPNYYTVTTRYEVLVDPVNNTTVWVREADEGYYRSLTADVSLENN